MRVRTERHGRIRRALAAAAATLLPLAVLAAPEAAANGLVVEAEDAVATTYTPGVVDDARMSGGRFLQLWTTTAPSTGDYRASYEVTAPEDGLYQLEVASTPPSGVTWASPYDLKVNDGAFEPVTQAVKGATITSEIAKYRLGTVNLTAGANTLTFRVDDRRALDTRYVMYVDALTLTPTDLKVQTITADGAPLNVIEDGSPATFTVALNGAAPQATQLSYVVRDYWSATVAQGTLPVAAGAESVAIDAGTLDIGHYSISAQVTGTAAVTTQASVVLAGADRTKPADSPFALDVAGGLLLPPDKWDAFARAMDLSGVTWIRERVSWGAVNPAAGQFDFTKDVRADGWTQALEGTGIKILEMMGGAPAWTRDSDKKLPNNLNAVYDFAKESAAYFADRGVEAWEFLNEVNAGSWTTPTETADQYAAVLKAAAIGYEDSGADPLVSAAGMAGAQPYPWLELMLRNE
ncbi:carbohydrate-binding protein, partial [Jiangella rhizosphaerae]